MKQVQRAVLLLMWFIPVVWYTTTSVGPVAATETSAELPSVKIVYWRSIDDLPLYVGVEKGFFREAGVNVELEFIKGEPNALAAVLRGDVNGGYI